jgi:C4-type Zn-finger protein
MKTCPDCHKSTRKHGEPTLSPGGFLDQIIVCSADCGWCGVDSKTLTEAEAEKFRVIANRPKQLRMEI